MALPRAGERVGLTDGRSVWIRPIAPADAAGVQSFIGRLSIASRYQRFFLAYRELPGDALDRIVGADQQHEVVLLAFAVDSDAGDEVVGLVQYADDLPDGAEVAVVVSDQWRRAGLATRMLQSLAAIALDHGVAQVQAEILRENTAALALAAKFDAKIGSSPGSPNLVRVARMLSAAQPAIQSG